MAAKAAAPKTSLKEKKRKAKPKASTVKLRKDGKPDGRSTRWTEVRELRAEADANQAEQTGRAVGRPTKYEPAMCDVVREMGKLGKTKEQIAIALGITRPTRLEYERLHPEFHDAIKEAQHAALAYWQGIAQEIAAGDRKANALAMIFSLKNQFPDDFRDRTENTTTVKHQFSEGFEDFIGQIAKDKRANQAKLIDAQVIEED